MITRIALALATLLSPRCFASLADDILIADFESESYGDWMVEGDAFGPGPAAGTLANQMHVSGFLGRRLVNSFVRGDQTTGRLISPPFPIDRPYINFLIGGGKYPGETCINLLVDGKVVRTATGPNDQPGGTEQLEWHTWDVATLRGQKASIEIVDKRTGGWGHINVDHIVQSDRKQQVQPQTRTLRVDRRYLLLPVKTGAIKRRMRFLQEHRTVREFEIELADGGEPDFFAFCDLRPFHNQQITIETALPAESHALESISLNDSLERAGKPGVPIYEEKNRPQFHFTSRCGWLNDPNGLVFHDGEYHLFYQHNPYGWNWGNMHWGHAVSRDLVHWQELPTALVPRQFGDWCFSGSAVLDGANTAGFQRDGEPVLVAAYTSTGRGESIAFSNDRGRTWADYDGNPVLKHQGRDPKLLWHAPTAKWVMAVYDETENSQNISFHTSANLKEWQFQSRIEGFYECPDLLEMAIEGGTEKSSPGSNAKSNGTKWVLYAADGRYLIGSFNGRQFTPESGPHQVWYGNFYAAQTFNHAPGRRHIQIGWGRGIVFPDMPFNQQMTIPVDLSLRNTRDGIRMFAEPVRELESLRGRKLALDPATIRAEIPLDLSGDLYDLDAEFELPDQGQNASCGFTIRGTSVVYDAGKGILSCGDVHAPLAASANAVRLRVLVDRGSIEVFANGGSVALSVGTQFSQSDRQVSVFSRGGAKPRSVVAYELRSAW